MENFFISITKDGDTIKVHATHTGEEGDVLDAGMFLLDALADYEGLPQTLGGYYSTGSGPH